MIYALHIGHDPRPGATWDPDGPGPEPALSEPDITRPLLDAIHRLYPGVVVEPMGATSGERRANIAATGLLCTSIELHLDSGHGRVARAFYAPWSRTGARVAHLLSRSISAAPIPWDCYAVDAGTPGYPRVLNSLAWTLRSKPAGVILELGFIDRAEHVSWLQNPANLEALAAAIVGGLDA